MVRARTYENWMKLQEKHENKILFGMGLKRKQKKSVKMRFNEDIKEVSVTPQMIRRDGNFVPAGITCDKNFFYVFVEPHFNRFLLFTLQSHFK